jgi:hypothetical protein
MGKTDKVSFEHHHMRAIVAGTAMFDPKTQRKIVAKTGGLWLELRNARKRQLLARP